MLLVLEGKVDTYMFPSKGSSKWDTCAGDGLIAAVGGVLTDIHGRILTTPTWPTGTRIRRDLW